MSGWTDVPLSTEGRDQAASLARRLQLEKLRFDAIYASPLQRAADTARALSDLCVRPIDFLDALREIGCGCVDGMLISEVQRHYPDYWHANLLQNDEAFRWPGGESYRELRTRCMSAISMLAARHSQQHVAIVTHAGVISQIVGSLHGLSPARWECFRPGNCSLTEIEWAGSSGRLVRFDDRIHLTATGSATQRRDSA